jgi:hypothetical protein
MRGVIGAYHKCGATPLVERNGGFVAKYMGAGLLAYFGYPQAYEHDAERAVRFDRHYAPATGATVLSAIAVISAPELADILCSITGVRHPQELQIGKAGRHSGSRHGSVPFFR